MTSPVLPSEFLVKSLDDAIEIIRECRKETGKWSDGWHFSEDVETRLDKQACRILMEAGK